MSRSVEVTGATLPTSRLRSARAGDRLAKDDSQAFGTSRFRLVPRSGATVPFPDTWLGVDDLQM